LNSLPTRQLLFWLGQLFCKERGQEAHFEPCEHSGRCRQQQKASCDPPGHKSQAKKLAAVQSQEQQARTPGQQLPTLLLHTRSMGGRNGALLTASSAAL
jgi:hypothetical protein